MALSIKPLHPLFCAEVAGADAGKPMDDATFAEIRAALDEYSVLVLHDQSLDDERQIAFSRRFGPLETSGKANPAVGTHFARQSNLDIGTGTVIPPEDRRMVYQKGNYLWHTDSSFKGVPSLCSLLSARVVPPEGGNTEFLCMRAAWDALPAAMKATIEPLIAEHSLQYSRDRVQKGILNDKTLKELPPVKQRLYRDNPVNGRRALYIGAHAGHIIGWPRATGEALLYELTERAQQAEFVLSHAWREGDVIVWDNRAVLHRATYYDPVKYKRFMQRTTIGGDVMTVPQ